MEIEKEKLKLIIEVLFEYINYYHENSIYQNHRELHDMKCRKIGETVVDVILTYDISTLKLVLSILKKSKIKRKALPGILESENEIVETY